MRFIDVGTCNPQRPWVAFDIAEIDDATVRLHWTDHPYHWHVNDGQDHVEWLTPDRVYYAEPGDEHLAHPAPRSPDSRHRAAALQTPTA